jgi:CyaY protein
VGQKSLSEQDFEREADATLHALEASLSEVADVEVELSAGILTLEFGDGTRFVVNSHRAAREIWMAADLRAWHFGFQPPANRWVAARSGDELWTTVESVVAQKLRRSLTLRPPL